MSVNLLAAESRVCNQETLFGMSTNPKNKIAAHLVGPFISAAKVAVFALKFIFDIVVLLPMGLSGGCRKGTSIKKEFKNGCIRLGVDIEGIARNIIKTIPGAGLYIANEFNKCMHKITGGKPIMNLLDTKQYFAVPRNPHSEPTPETSIPAVPRNPNSEPTPETSIPAVPRNPNSEPTPETKVCGLFSKQSSATDLSSDFSARIFEVPADVSTQTESVSLLSEPGDAGVLFYALFNNDAQQILRTNLDSILKSLERVSRDMGVLSQGDIDILGAKLNNWALEDLGVTRRNRIQNNKEADVRDLINLEVELKKHKAISVIFDLTAKIVKLLIESQDNLTLDPAESDFMKKRLENILKYKNLWGDAEQDKDADLAILNLVRLQIEDDIFWSKDAVRGRREELTGKSAESLL